MKLSELQTPCLLLDPKRLERNAARMRSRAAALGVRLRPHLKTTKSVEVARLAHGGERGPITVSTVREAEYFAAAGHRDILYAVCVTPDKLDRISQLTAAGVEVHLLVDSVAAARAVADHPGLHSALVEIDCGEHRTGIGWDSAALLDIAGVVAKGPRARLMGVMTHAGHSYACRTVEAVRRVAAEERAAVVRAAGRLRAAGLPCPIVSVGSTPTAVHVDHLDGVSEMRPGVYLLGDLFQAGIGSCQVEDLAASVLTTVLSHQPDRGRVIVDAGGLALSKDRSTRGEPFDAGYGQLATLQGRVLEGLIVASVHQEHGEVLVADEEVLRALPVGARLRVFPNHVCMTAAMYDRYHVLSPGGTDVEVWPRVNGWGPLRGSSKLLAGGGS